MTLETFRPLNCRHDVFLGKERGRTQVSGGNPANLVPSLPQTFNCSLRLHFCRSPFGLYRFTLGQETIFSRLEKIEKNGNHPTITLESFKITLILQKRTRIFH